MPPSVHESGNPYRWAEGLSLDDLNPPELPEAVLAALRQRSRRRREMPVASSEPGTTPIPNIAGISGTTKQFLRGDFANGPQWNNRLFAAACDLCGCGVSLAEAIPMLVAGAKPVNAVEQEKARATITSAYSQQRVCGRDYANEALPQGPIASWQVGEITVNQIEHLHRRRLPSARRISLES